MSEESQSSSGTANTEAENGEKGFQKGVSDNPVGRPKGSRNKATILAESLLNGEAEAITLKAIELAKEGNLVALRLCLERLLPPQRARSITFALPSQARSMVSPGSMKLGFNKTLAEMKPQTVGKCRRCG